MISHRQYEFTVIDGKVTLFTVPFLIDAVIAQF